MAMNTNTTESTMASEWWLFVGGVEFIGEADVAVPPELIQAALVESVKFVTNVATLRLTIAYLV